MMNSEDFVPPLAANMSAAFKKVRGAIGASDPLLTDLIVTTIVELAKDGVYDIEELASRTLSSLKLAGYTWFTSSEEVPGVFGQSS
jgi:hypothetical protein